MNEERRTNNDEPQAAQEGVAEIRLPVTPSWRTHVVCVSVLVLAGVLFGLPTLPEPFGVDQGIYAYIAERLLEGAVDHRDVFDHKPPGIHFAYAKAFFVFGHTMWSIRLLDLLAALATAVALYVVGFQWLSARAGAIAGLLYLGFYLSSFDWMSRAQPEAWINLTFIAGLAACSFGRAVQDGNLGKAAGYPSAPFLAGILLGAGVCFKPTILMLAPVWLFPLIRHAASRESEPWRHFGRDVALLAGGAVAVSAVVLVYYAWNRALRDLYEAVIVFNSRYHSRLELVRGWSDFRSALLNILRPLSGLTWLAVSSVLFFASSRFRIPLAMGFAWFALALGTIFWQGSFARSHCVILLPPLVFLAVSATDGATRLVWSLCEREPAGERVPTLDVVSAFLVAAAAVLAGFSLIDALHQRWTKFYALAARSVTQEQYYASFWLKGAPGKGGYSFQDLREIASYLEAHTTPQQTILVWGFRPILAWLAHRRMPSRFCFRYPLTRANNPRWWNEFLGELDRSPPEFFVVVLDDRGRYHPETSKESLENNGALSRFLHERYALDRTMTDFEIWRLKK